LWQEVAAVAALVALQSEGVEVEGAGAPEPYFRDPETFVERELVDSTARYDDLEDDIGNFLLFTDAVALVGLRSALLGGLLEGGRAEPGQRDVTLERVEFHEPGHECLQSLVLA